MTCTRTGAHIFLWQYGVYAYGDAFEIEGHMDQREALLIAGSEDKVAYFRIVSYSYKGPINNMPRLHYIVREIESWWKDEPISTLITKAGGFENLGYEGKPLSEVIK